MIAVKRARSALLRKREELLLRHTELQDGQRQLLEERETDVPDIAAERTAAQVLGELDEVEHLELVRVDRALARIEAGNYGVCLVCGAGIPVKRLRVLPEADRCAGCTSCH